MRPAVPRVLALHPDAVGALLHVAGLVDHQDRTRVAERVDDVVAQIVAHRVGVPAGPCQQMLQPVRGGRAAVLGDGPAILAVQARDHPGHQLAGMPQGLVAGETRRDPIDHRRELRPPPIRVYAMNRGDRGIFSCLHKLEQCRGHRPDQRRHARIPPAPIYGCSTRQANVLAALPKSAHSGALAAMREISIDYDAKYQSGRQDRH